ncbi:MAG: hypothetical protein ACK5V3_16930 [Bdellovibrionales bacterium]
MFRAVKLIIILSFFTITATAAYRVGGAYAEPSSWVPDPWATELPVTLNNLQGVWSVGKSPNRSYFYFRVTRDPNNPKVSYISVIERDSGTCQVVATGFGRDESGTRLYVEMRDPSGRRHKLMLRQYSAVQITPGQGIEGNKGKVTVLTVMLPQGTKFNNYPLIKISDRTELECRPEKSFGFR